MERRLTVSDSYLYVFLNSAFSKGDLLSFLTLGFLFLARVLPIIALAPFFGARVLPHPVKVTFALCLFVIFLPQLLLNTTVAPNFNMQAVVLMFKELFVGFTMGFIISLPFIIVQNCGIIIDHQRGGASLMVNDPTIQNQSSPLGTIFNFVLIYLFFTLDLTFMIIDAISTSYEIIPPDKFINPNFFNKEAPFWKMQLDILNKVMVLSIQLAMPALLIMLMTDLFLGIANRLAPQVQITFLGMSLKSLLGLAIVTFGWSLFIETIGKQSFEWVRALEQMLRMFKPSVST